MYHTFPPAASFWPFLLTIDQDLAETTRRRGCPCGGACTDPIIPASLAAIATRSPIHTTPGSVSAAIATAAESAPQHRRVRFLGRKVYVVRSSFWSPPCGTDRRRGEIRELSALFGVDRRTIARWQEFWREHFPQTHFWKIAGARLALHCNLATLPLSLLTAFVRHSDDHEGWGRLLHLLSPITTATGPPS